MSSGEVRRLSSQDLQTVQNLIERCIQLHMSRTDAVNVLLREAKIQPDITELVWQRLEEENREFFEAYHIRLALNDQIKLFNELLKQQAAAMMRQIQSTETISIPASNGCHMAQFQQNAGCYTIDQPGPSMRPESVQPTMAASIPYTNGASTMQTPTSFNLSSTRRNDHFLPNSLHIHGSNSMRLMQELNGGTTKKESVYPTDSQIIFGAGGNVVDTHDPMDNVAFSHLDATSQPLNDPLLGVEISAFGQLGQIPKNFSFPDLSAYPHMDLLDHFPNSAFTTDPDSFLDSRDRDDITEENKLETISESYSIEGFGGSE